METIHFNWLDIAILAVFLFFMLVGVWYGFVRTLIWLCGWVLATYAAFYFRDQLANEFLVGFIDEPNIRLTVAMIILFVLTLLLVGIIIRILGELIEFTGMTATDRNLGAVLGLVMGIFVVLVGIVISSWTVAPKSKAWKGSYIMPHMVPYAMKLGSIGPKNMNEYIRDLKSR